MTPNSIDPEPVFAFLAHPRLFAAVLILTVLVFAAGIVGGVLFLFRERPITGGIVPTKEEAKKALCRAVSHDVSKVTVHSPEALYRPAMFAHDSCFGNRRVLTEYLKTIAEYAESQYITLDMAAERFPLMGYKVTWRRDDLTG
jgi:hypothetical protein